MGGGKVIEIGSKAEWDAQMSGAGDKAVIVDFSAVWCGPCQMIGPVFVQLSSQYDNIVFLKVDVDANAVGWRAGGRGQRWPLDWRVARRPAAEQ
jgi:thioredoxin 1